MIALFLLHSYMTINNKIKLLYCKLFNDYYTIHYALSAKMFIILRHK